MRVWGAIDLREGVAVQLVGGRPETERVRVADVDDLVDRWSAVFGGVHVVDLDAALGSGANIRVIERILERSPLPVQVGGGLRSEAAVAHVLESGAARAIVGTRAVDDPAWLAALAARWPGRVVLAADQREGVVLRRGWTEASPLRVEELLEQCAGLPLAAILVTDVTREGALGGIDAAAFGRHARACALPLIAAGGIAALPDLHALRAAGVAEAVVGMAAYTGGLDLDAVAREFGSRGIPEMAE